MLTYLTGIRPAMLYSHIDLQVNNGVLLYYTGIVQSIYEKYLANPPQIATEAIPTFLCSEQPPESQKKSLGKSKWWNIVKIIYN